MKNQYYLKDKKAMIYWQDLGGQDDLGFPVKGGYIPFSPVLFWCYSRQLTQDQVYAALQYGVDETRLFVFNNIPGIEVYDYILYRGLWYQITRVDTADDYRGDMFVYAKDCPAGGKPKPDELMPYKPCSRSVE